MFRYLKIIFIFLILCSILLNTGCFNSKASNKKTRIVYEDEKLQKKYESIKREDENYQKKFEKCLFDEYEEEKKQIDELEPKAEAGDIIAQYSLGKLYLKDEHKNYEKAFKYLKMSAEQGYSASQLLLGDMYHHGLGVDKNNAEALTLYRKVANRNQWQVRNLIAIDLEGEGIEEDVRYQRAMFWFLQVVDKEDIFLEYLRFYLYEPILGKEQDYEKVFKYFSNPKESYYQNYNLFRYCLAYMYENGLGTDKDVEKAKYWYDKIGDNGKIKRFRKMQKNPLKDIQYTFGIIYNNTPDVNYKEALYYFIESAEKGNSDSEYWLYKYYNNNYENLVRNGCYYRLSEIQENEKQALKYLMRSAEHGNWKAIYRVIRNLEGEGIERDKKIIDLLLKWADSGNTTAMWVLGEIYANAKDIKKYLKVNKNYKDYKKAIEWITKSADNGCIVAMSDLAFMYYYGKGVKKDYKQAFKWWSKIIKLENRFEEPEIVSISEFMMAWMYEHGLGGDKDIYKAIELYRLAEEYGKPAQYRLAFIYEHGLGVEKDKREAEFWYAKIGSKEDIKECKKFINSVKLGRFFE